MTTTKSKGSGRRREARRRRWEKQWPRDPISEAQLQCVFDELCWEAENGDDSSSIMVSLYICALSSSIHLRMEDYVESKGVRDPVAHLKRDPIAATSTYEKAPNSEKDWHPGSQMQVLDLVHPSFYCICIRTTIIRARDTLA